MQVSLLITPSLCIPIQADEGDIGRVAAAIIIHPNVLARGPMRLGAGTIFKRRLKRLGSDKFSRESKGAIS